MARVKRDEVLEVRVTGPEKDAFSEAATITGVALSAWVRQTLRRAAARELEEAGRTVPFLTLINR